MGAHDRMEEVLKAIDELKGEVHELRELVQRLAVTQAEWAGARAGLIKRLDGAEELAVKASRFEAQVKAVFAATNVLWGIIVGALALWKK